MISPGTEEIPWHQGFNDCPLELPSKNNLAKDIISLTMEV